MNKTDGEIKSAILVVDDEPFFRQLIKDVLKHDYEVVEASSGKDVEALINRYSFSAVLTDYEMPGISGRDVLLLIKRLQPDLPVILVSSHHNFDDARQVFRDGALDYLVKPFSEAELSEAVRRAVIVYKDNVLARTRREESDLQFADLVLLREVGETASGEADIESLLERILDYIVEAVHVETASLMLADEDCLTIRASRGLPKKVVPGTKVSIEGTVAGHVFKTGEPVLLGDMNDDGRFVPVGDKGQYRTRSALSLPLKSRDKVIGVLNVNNKRDGDTFSATDQYFLASVIHQASLAIENLDLVNKLKLEAHRLDTLNRVRTRLVCNLSHELRTPLTTVLGFSDLILNHREMISDSDLLDYMGKVQGGSLQMERLISEMMLLFSLDSGTVTWSLKTFGFREMCEAVLNSFNSRIAEEKLSVNLWVSPKLPKLLNDSDKLQAVIEAMIDNAVKFNRPGGLISISADSLTADPGKIHFRIYNDGNKVPEDAAEGIFVPYNQLGELNTDKPTGVGIGLTLCKTIIETMRGDIYLESTEEEGTAFSIVLPLQCNHLQESAEK